MGIGVVRDKSCVTPGSMNTKFHVAGTGFAGVLFGGVADGFFDHALADRFQHLGHEDQSAGAPGAVIAGDAFAIPCTR